MPLSILDDGCYDHVMVCPCWRCVCMKPKRAYAAQLCCLLQCLECLQVPERLRWAATERARRTAPTRRLCAATAPAPARPAKRLSVHATFIVMYVVYLRAPKRRVPGDGAVLPCTRHSPRRPVWRPRRRTNARHQGVARDPALAGFSRPTAAALSPHAHTTLRTGLFGCCPYRFLYVKGTHQYTRATAPL